MLKFINKRKGLAILFALAIVLFVVLLVIFISLFFGHNTSVYGDRLDGIEEVSLSKSDLKEIESFLEEDVAVESASCRLKGKIIYINYQVDASTTDEIAKSIADSVLEKFSDEELGFYDFSFLIKRITIVEDEEEISAFAGYRKADSDDGIVW